MSFGIHYTNYGLKLDFNPIIAQFNLKGNYVLQHWQAKPFGLRNFGYLSVVDNQSRYLTIAADKIAIVVCPEPLQIDETKNKGLVPTAVLLYRNSLLIHKEGNWYLINQ